ncbi:DUF2911 domain-containing protein [Gracilimonas amylolytica]|uniref:DUF2911 domain-containing protein n=1 Tax=Gracilimonas amylolytica TaxID=1749045 RepID=UPI000CD8523D|nr:DUF2911 domain-containing protein [Gracilimonas amylolytica]
MDRSYHIYFLGTLTILITLVLFNGCGNGNTENNGPSVETRKSPIAIASIKSNSTYIKVVYGQPYRKGRTIFGDLEPWGQVWRTGANEATEMTITDTILMGDEAISPGTYALLTIPEPDSFTVILNHELGQWGAFNYNPERDYKRMKFPVTDLDEPVEAFTFEFSKAEYSMTTMSLKWGLVQVDVPTRLYGE